MQLTNAGGSVRLGVMAASCALLATTVEVTEADAADKRSTKVDAGLMYYQENLGRIRSYDAIVDLRQDFGDERILSGHVAFDTLSGGSPNGAVPTKAAQTFATPSGTSLQASTGSGPVTYTTASGRTVAQLAKVTLYTTAAGALPLDPNFKDNHYLEPVPVVAAAPLGEGRALAVARCEPGPGLDLTRGFHCSGPARDSAFRS